MGGCLLDAVREMLAAHGEVPRFVLANEGLWLSIDWEVAHTLPWPTLYIYLRASNACALERAAHSVSMSGPWRVGAHEPTEGVLVRSFSLTWSDLDSVIEDFQTLLSRVPYVAVEYRRAARCRVCRGRIETIAGATIDEGEQYCLACVRDALRQCYGQPSEHRGKAYSYRDDVLGN